MPAALSTMPSRPALAPRAPVPLQAQAAPQDALRRALGAFATGVTVITAQDRDGRPIGLTANSFTSVSLDPALVLWCLSARSANLAVFREAQAYAINVLAAHQMPLCRRFSDRNVIDRFDGVDYHLGESGAPVIRGCLASFECEPWQAYPGGDHVLFVGKVTRVSQGQGEPLVFSHGKLGTFHSQSVPA